MDGLVFLWPSFQLNFTAESANRLYTLYCHPTSLLFSLLAARARALGTFRLEKRNIPGAADDGCFRRLVIVESNINLTDQIVTRSYYINLAIYYP